MRADCPGEPPTPEDMIRSQLRNRGISDERILDAMRRVPRERFVPADRRRLAYADQALPIDMGQTISQPYIVAAMIAALRLESTDRVLEVGAGTGYAAAVMSLLAAEVFAIERHPELAESARERVAQLGYTNVHVIAGDGSQGLPEHAPFDAISVAAAADSILEPLRSQLVIGGRLVMPVGAEGGQQLVRVTRRGLDAAAPASFEEESLGPVRFVPLISDPR